MSNEIQKIYKTTNPLNFKGDNIHGTREQGIPTQQTREGILYKREHTNVPRFEASQSASKPWSISQSNHDAQSVLRKRKARTYYLLS
jgi:hypothetical protein